ncbi:hypothetical protein [Halegenticoccus tardaugens]|uniref:hypothetical protein n=1 Tax=Halegenticoccus tardaugens TaxID=2071624 RepID=UPI00100B7C5C|nr:hypothetical protein [Halegenticoccus tardaugens]
MGRIALGAFAVLAAAVSLAAHAWFAYAASIALDVDPLVLGGAVLLLVVSALRRAFSAIEATDPEIWSVPLGPTLGRIVGFNAVALLAYRLLPAALVRGGVSLVVGATGAYLVLATAESILGRRSPT